MKRSQFIKNLLATLGVVALPIKSVKQYDKFYLLQFFIRGFSYYDGPALLNEMHEGDMLEMVREPGNEYDADAIALHFNSRKVGFVPAESNEILARLIDAGVIEFMTEITNLKPEAKAWENVQVAVYVLKECEFGKPMDASAKCLTQLETPEYHSIKFSDESIVRIYEKEDYDYQEG